jgi:hypothetical protein
MLAVRVAEERESLLRAERVASFTGQVKTFLNSDCTPALPLLKRRKTSCQNSKYKQEQTKEHAVVHWTLVLLRAACNETLAHMPVTGSNVRIQPNALFPCV